MTAQGVGGSWGRHCGDVCATGLWVAPLPVHRDGEGPPGPLRLVWPCVNASGRRQAWAAWSHLSYPTAPGAPNLSVATHVRSLLRAEVGAPPPQQSRGRSCTVGRRTHGLHLTPTLSTEGLGLGPNAGQPRRQLASGGGGELCTGQGSAETAGAAPGGAWLPRVLEPWNSEECGGSKATRVNPTRLSAKEGLPLC